MSDGPSPSITEAAQAIAAITENVPVYQDAVQPAAKEIGKGLELVAKAVNAALSPVEVFVWGVDQIRDFVHKRVAKKLENVRPEDIQAPKPHIAVPTIDALRYTGSEEDLADLYANLLAASMDRNTAYSAHPGFVDIIKNMAPDEARVMRFLARAGDQPIVNIKLIVNAEGHFRTPHRHVSLIGLKAGCQHPVLTSNYLDNLCRLGLIEIPDRFLTKEALYEEIENFPQIKSIIEGVVKNEAHRVEIEKKKVEITDLGKQFIQACVVGKSVKNSG